MLRILFLLTAAVHLQAAPRNTDLTVDAINFISNFGYYQRPNAKLGEIANVKQIRDSIREMQRFAGIPETGKVDAKTKELIETPRCGLPDTSPRTDTRKRRYTLQGSTWKKFDLTWRLTNENNDGLTRAQVESVMEQAFDKWQKVTNLNFKKIPLEESGPVDIEVKFVRNYHDDPYPFDGPGGTLAHAFYPHNNEGLSGDVHFDDDEEYTIGKPTGRSLLWVAVHEIGHSIGLEHSDVRNAVMFPYYRGNGGKDFDLHADDTLGIQTLYGSRVAEKTTVTPNPSVPTKAVKTTQAPKTTEAPTFNIGCTDTFKAVFLDKKSQETYVINDDKVYILSATNLRLIKGPIQVSKVFSKVTSVDAAYVNGDGNVVLFSGNQYYEYNNPTEGRLLNSGSIHKKFRGLPESVQKIDAAFIWPGNGRTYFFTGKDYYRFNARAQTMDYGYPRAILGPWKGLPESIDAVFVWRNKVTYFFKGNKYYRFDDTAIAVKKGYPLPILSAWTKCSLTGALEGKGKSSSNSNLSSYLLSFAMVFAVKFLV